jgi:hypothetical protein
MGDTTRVNATAPSRVEKGQKQGGVAKDEYLKTDLAKTHEIKDAFIPTAHGTWGEGAKSAITPILKGAKRRSWAPPWQKTSQQTMCDA